LAEVGLIVGDRLFSVAHILDQQEADLNSFRGFGVCGVEGNVVDVLDFHILIFRFLVWLVKAGAGIEPAPGGVILPSLPSSNLGHRNNQGGLRA
jgi:hypothetical protein